MSTLEDILSFLQLDFLSLDCATGRNSYYTKVLAMSFAPIGAIVLNFLVCGWRMIEKARSSVVDRNNLQYEAAVKEQQQLQSNSSGFADEPKHIKSQSHDDSDGIELMPSPAKPLGAAEHQRLKKIIGVQDLSDTKVQEVAKYKKGTVVNFGDYPRINLLRTEITKLLTKHA